MENIPKRSASILEYILNHRKDIINKLEDNKYFEKFDDENINIENINIENIITENKITENKITKDIEILMHNEIQEKRNNNKNKNYYNLLKWYWVYLFYGFIGGVFINSISNTNILKYDMFFNVLSSPIIYYHSPKNILTNISKIKFIKFYTIPFIIGLFFRFLEYIPALGSFVIDPKYIVSTLDYILISVILCFILLLSLYYLFISSNPILNSILLISQFLITFLVSYFFYKSGGNIHIHHYFIALIIMLVSKNYHSSIIIIIHSISYGVFIEGISKWGFDSIAW
jgi:hypothetical protein